MSGPTRIDPLFVELQTALAGRYSLERQLGRGGMGVVYLARDVQLDRLVAIKLLPPDLAGRAAFRERFLREARIAARLSHPNIVPIHAVEESGRLVWFVMAYVPGETLGERVRARGALTPAEASRILRDVAWALGYAHSQGVAHRDVKPDNILLEAGGRRALIADFGIAAPLRGELPDDSIAGTVAYLSPEQARGDAVDGRTDIYSLGVVAYYALSGRLPYPAATLAELIERQLAGAPPSLTVAAPHVPRALCRVVDRCLAGYPSARFQTGEELADALAQLSAGATDLPAPLRVWLAQGGQRRRPAFFISAAWGLPMFVGGLIGWLFTPRAGAWIPTIGFGALVLALPWSAFALLRVLHTRKVLRAGYTHADITHALSQYIERRREELAFEHGVKTTVLGKVLNGAVVTLGLASLGLVLGSAVISGAVAAKIAAAGALTGVGAVALFYLRNFVPGARAGTRDRLAEFAHRFWKGRVGQLLARLAGWRLRTRSAPDQILHRPTEVALGEAAEALFRALPAGQRQDLRQLPEQIRFLSEQAQAMRRRLEELDDLIAQAAPDTLFGERSKAGGDGGAAELKEARDLWAGRLGETVGLLESLRVGLLKLHAGSAVPEALTADLAAARELKQRLALLAEGQAEADRLLRGRS